MVAPIGENPPVPQQVCPGGHRLREAGCRSSTGPSDVRLSISVGDSRPLGSPRETSATNGPPEQVTRLTPKRMTKLLERLQGGVLRGAFKASRRWQADLQATGNFNL